LQILKLLHPPLVVLARYLVPRLFYACASQKYLIVSAFFLPRVVFGVVHEDL
jgi:hypothetical protein